MMQGFFQEFGQGGLKWGVMGYWEAKQYDPPGSKHTFDKLGIQEYMFPDQGYIDKVWYFV